MRVPIDKIAISNDRPKRLDLGNMDFLISSLRSRGLQYPIIVDQAFRLISGERRLQAATALGWREIECRVAIGYLDTLDAITTEFDETTRDPIEVKPMLSSEVAAFCRWIEQRARVDGRIAHLVNVDKIAKALGTSGSNVRRTWRVMKAVQYSPEKYGDLIKLMNEDCVYSAVRELEKRQGLRRNEEAAVEEEMKQNRSTAIFKAHEAINSLKKISKSDPNRKRALQIVMDFIKANPGD